jgi:hypothetical protein
MRLCAVVIGVAVSLSQSSRAEVLLEQTLAIALNGEEVGTLHALDQREGKTTTLRRDNTMVITRGASKSQMSTKTVVVVDAKGRPLSYHFERTDPSGTMITDGTLRGTELTLVTTQNGASVPSTIVVPAGATMSLALEHSVRRRPKPQPPKTQHVILEEIGAVVDLTTEVTATTRDTVMVRSSFSGIETMEEIDRQGRTIASRTAALGIVSYPPGQAPADIGAGKSDLLAVSTWKVQRVPRDASRVVYRIRTEDAARFVVPEDDRQRIIARTATTVDVAVEGEVSAKTLTKARRAVLLQATPYEAIDDERIKGTAQRLIDGAPSDSERVRRLTEFVYGHVARKSMDRGYAPAVATLESKAGDCTEHSVLLSALLRSIGLPTRIIDGIIVDGESAGYHEWVEVFLEGRGFIAVDPTFNAWPAGAERLKLAEGTSAPAEQLQLSLAAARLLSHRVELEVLEAR